MIEQFVFNLLQNCERKS